MSERMCSIESCERPYIAKGLCSYRVPLEEAFDAYERALRGNR